MSGFIERSGLPSSTVLTVLDDKGIVQYRSVEMERYIGKFAGDYATALGGAADSAVDTTGLDGIERLYVAEPLEFRGQRTGSRVTLGIPLGSVSGRDECVAAAESGHSRHRHASSAF